jgi:hypothetical protein
MANKQSEKKEDTNRYNVFCQRCDSVWQPELKSPLWWQAKRLADTGRLDALCVSPEKCGCVQRSSQRNPKAPFRVFGYNCFCEDFDIPCNSFIEAVKKFRDLAEIGRLNTVFIDGISQRVQDRLEYGI